MMLGKMGNKSKEFVMRSLVLVELCMNYQRGYTQAGINFRASEFAMPRWAPTTFGFTLIVFIILTMARA